MLVRGKAISFISGYRVNVLYVLMKECSEAADVVVMSRWYMCRARKR
jgi:hypothetical protein